MGYINKNNRLIQNEPIEKRLFSVNFFPVIVVPSSINWRYSVQSAHNITFKGKEIISHGRIINLIMGKG